MGFNPSLEQYPEEAAVIGLMVVGYGELEFLFGLCCGLAVNDDYTVLKLIHTVRSESARIEVAEIVSRPGFQKRKLLDKYAVALKALRWCKSVRNQYAHAQWGQSDGGLRFSDPDDAFTGDKFKPIWRDIRLDLLQKQLAYFGYARDCLLYLEQQCDDAQRTRGRRQEPREWPQQTQPPSKHSLPD